MAEEEIKKVEPPVPETKEPEKEKELSEIETKALAQGWNPDWQGAPEEFIDAAEFVRRKPLFDKIESQRRFYDKKLKDVELTLNQLASHHAKVREVEYLRALKEIRTAKREALKEGDTSAVLEMEDKIEEMAATREAEIRQIAEEQIKQQPQAGPSIEFQEWSRQNPWYLQDEDMHDFANGVSISFVNRAKIKGMSLTEQQIFDHVTEKVRKAYPDKFGITQSNPNRDRPSTVGNGDRQGKGSPKPLPKLPPEYEDVARNFEKSGTMKREDYIRQLSEMGVI